MAEEQQYVGILVSTLEKQVGILEEILEITKEQERIAGQPTFAEETFADTLNRKDILIARLNELDDGFANVYGRVKTQVREHKMQYEKELNRMQELIKQSTDLGVEIQVLEERNRERLVQCFSNQHKQYGAKQTAASVASRYHQTMNGGKMRDTFFAEKK